MWCIGICPCRCTCGVLASARAGVQVAYWHLSVQVYVWEIDAYDDSGVSGGPPSPRRNPVSLREMVGVNGIWGWGWGKSSTALSAGQGAALYAPVASYGRNYHNLNWDVHDPDEKPDYVRMAQV